MLGSNDKRADFVYTMNVAEELGLFRKEREAIMESIVADIEAMQEDGMIVDSYVVEEIADAYDVNLSQEEWQFIYDNCDLIR